MSHRPGPTPLSLTLSYAALGAAWIVATDYVASWWTPSGQISQIVSGAKGLLFIGLTSGALYLWARRFHGITRQEAEASAQATVRAERSRRLYATLREVNRHVIRSTDATALCQSVCDALVSPGGLTCGWIGRVGDGGRRLTMIAHAGGIPPPEIELEGLPSADAARLGSAIQRGEPAFYRTTAEDASRLGRFHSDASASMCAALPFTPTGGDRMLLGVCSRDAECFTPDMMTLLAELTADLQFGIETLRQRDAHAAAEAALRASEQALAREVARCRALLDVSVDAIQVIDLEGNLLDANEIFLRELGFARAQISSLRIQDWNAGFSAGEIRAKLAAITSEPQRFETIHRRVDGSLFAVEGRAKRVEVDGRTVIYATTRDLTERRELEQRFLRAQRLESVGLIASGIAHDLNNVLTPILLSTGLLEMRYSAPEDEALLKPIEAAARRGSNIVQQILTFARGADGQRVAIEPSILLKELINMIRETFPRNIVHQLHVAGDAWRVLGDPTQLHQVFLNLAVNARDAMPAGGTLKISVENRDVTEDVVKLIPSGHVGKYVCITVSDTGTGMTPEVLDHLFEPFFTTKPRGRGTGLGLSTVHGLVRGHGGFVEVDSRLGHGSAFRVFLPAALASNTGEQLPETPAPRRIGTGEHILITDDEPAILSVLASVLRRNGFVPHTASDGDEALTLLERAQPAIAVVITDVMMPKFDGVRLAAEVRLRHPQLPVIAMSGMISPMPDDDSRRQLRELGVTAVLDKPYAEPDLLKAITAALGRG